MYYSGKQPKKIQQGTSSQLEGANIDSKTFNEQMGGMSYEQMI